MQRIILALFVALFAAVPTQAAVIYIPYTVYVPEPEVGNYTNIRKVGVVVAMGETMRLRKVIGFLNIKNETRTIVDWKVNDLIAATIHQTLSSRFELTDLPVDQATVVRQIDPGLFLNNTAPLRKFLQAYNRPDLDAFFVVRPFWLPELPGEDAGIGLQMNRDESPWLWTNYEITLVDAKSFKIVARSYARVRLQDGTRAAFPGLRTTNQLQMDDKLTASDAHTALLKTWVLRLVRLTLIESMRSLEFGVQMPPTAERQLVPIPEELRAYRGVKRVAIVSALGDRLDISWRGTLFRHWLRKLPVDEWNFDSEIEAMVAASLDKRFTAHRVAVDRARLAQVAPIINRDNLSVPIDALPVSQDVDAYIVVLKRGGAVTLDDKVSGIGLWQLSPMGDDQSGMFAHYSVVVVDAKTLKPISMRAGVGGARFPGAVPGRKVENAIFPMEGDLTPENRQFLHQAFKDLMADSLEETLLQSGLRGLMRAPLTALDDSGAPMRPGQPRPQAPLPADANVVPPASPTAAPTAKPDTPQP